VEYDAEEIQSLISRIKMFLCRTSTTLYLINQKRRGLEETKLNL